jgi:hypothetical protein
MPHPKTAKLKHQNRKSMNRAILAVVIRHEDEREAFGCLSLLGAKDH